MRAIRNALVGLAALIACGVCGIQAIRFQIESQKQKLESLRELTTLAPFRSVQSGRSSVTISDLALLGMLSDDSECIKNMTSVAFASVAFRPSDSARLSRLTNLVSIGFYDCDNVDLVIASCFGPQVHTIAFEAMLLSKNSVDLLRDATSVDVTMNGRSIRED